MLAEVAQPAADTATDAVQPGPEQQLTEPFHVSGDHASLREFNLQLIDQVTGPQPEQVIQGNLDNCPVAATLAALAHATPEAIRVMLSERPARIRSRVRGEAPGEYVHESNRLITAQFQGQRAVEVSSLLWMSGGRIAYCRSTGNFGWMSYIEKAYAVWRGRNSYHLLSQIGSGQGDALGGTHVPDTREVFADLVGSWMMADLTTNTRYDQGGGSSQFSPRALAGIVGNAPDLPTIAASRADITRQGGIEPSHSYAVMRFRQNVVHLRNPRGGADADVAVPFEQFRQLYMAVIQSA